jgi:histidyl-tRNA synthetase
MSALRLTAPRGVADVLPQAAGAWQRLEAVARDVFRRYGFAEIRTPMFEATELFLRSVGEDTDIVAKEMYTFVDRGGRSVTLRPEGTAGVVRAYLEHGMNAGPQPVKLCYVSAPMFRYDRPEAGRYRQFHQMGVEVLGAAAPAADAEVIAAAHALIADAGLPDAAVRLNSVGDAACRPAYRERLRDHYRPHLEALCPDCRVRFDRNPLRLLDCKQPQCAPFIASAPTLADALCDACRAHLDEVQALLTAARIPFRLDPGIVRGLDYYTRTVFEVVHPTLGALCGGGRYDGLVEELGGPPTPAVGFALGVERLLLALGERGVEAPAQAPEVFVACAAEELRQEAFRTAMAWRGQGVAAEVDLLGRSFRAQMRHADRLGARFVAVVGRSEVERGTVTVRDMGAGTQEEVEAAGAVAYLRQRLAPAGA